MKTKLSNLLSRLCRSRFFRSFFYKYSYRGLGLGRNITLNVKGTFIYQDGSGVNEGSNILVPKNASLSLGKNSYLGRYVEISSGENIQIGNFSSIQDRCILLGNVSIGQYCSFGPNIYASSGRHHYDYLPQYLIKDQDRMVANLDVIDFDRPVDVGDDCWIGANVVITSGVSIGKGAIVAANSVVCQNVLPYTVVAGIPAKIINYRLDFKPPISISYSEEKSWPYFYAGFQLSLDELHQNEHLLCIVAYKKFEMHLRKCDASTIYLRVVLLNAKFCTISYEGQTAYITEFNQVIQFKISSDSKSSARFVFESKGENNMSLGIQEAWLQ